MEPARFWELHGASLYAMARLLLGDEVAARRAVVLGVADLYRRTTDETRFPDQPRLRSAARCVYRRCEQPSATTGSRGAGRDPGGIEVAERRALALCVYGGHSYREAAAVIGTTPDSTARLLVSGLRELARLSPS